MSATDKCARCRHMRKQHGPKGCFCSCRAFVEGKPRAAKRNTKNAGAPSGKRNTKRSAAGSNLVPPRSSRYLFDDDEYDPESVIHRQLKAEGGGSETSYGPAGVVSLRLEAATLDGIDKVAKAMGWTRTGAIKQLMSAPLALLLNMLQRHELAQKE